MTRTKLGLALSWIVPAVVGLALLITGIMLVFLPMHENAGLDQLARKARVTVSASGAKQEAQINFDAIEHASSTPIRDWLSVEGAGIDLPIMQASKQDPIYWLRHNLSGAWSIGGVPFIDARTNGDAAHVLVYGHNMGSVGGMFTSLHDAWQQSRFDAVLSGGATWETKTQGATKLMPLCALKVDENYQPIQRFVWNSIEEYRDWLKGIAASANSRSYEWEELVSRATRDVTLVTCSSVISGQTGRTIVIFVEE